MSVTTIMINNNTEARLLLAVDTVSNYEQQEPTKHNQFRIINNIANNPYVVNASTSESVTYFSNRNNLAKFNWWNSLPQSHPSPAPLLGDECREAPMPMLTPALTTTAAQKYSQESPQTKLLNNKNTAIWQLPPTSPTPASHVPIYPSCTSSQIMIAGNAAENQSIQQTQHFPQSNLMNQYDGTDEQISQGSQLLVKDKKPCVGLLNPNEEDEMKITGYRRSRYKTVLCWICIFLTGGLLRLLMHWWRHWHLIATHEMCSLEEAEQVLIQEDYQEKHKIFYVKQVQNLNVSDLKNYPKQKQLTNVNGGGDINTTAIQIEDEIDEQILYLSVHFSSAQFKLNKHVRIFNCKQLRYAWDNQSQSFNKLKGLDVNVSSAYFHQQKGLSPQEQQSRRVVYGLNEITVPYKTVKTLLFLEVLNPFYVFQIFSVILWFAYDYYYYACVIVLMSTFGILMSIIQTKKNQYALRETVQSTGCALVVTEKGKVREISTQYLVPGDIIEIPSNGCTMLCDAVLLSGNCILDESMLTGESVPVTKTPLPMKRDVIYDKKDHARHTIFCGTKVIQTRYIGSQKVLAMVINTGNITAKGGLIRSILYPPPVDYKFEQDSYKFIECLGLIALIGFIYTLITKIMRDVDPVKIAVESLDLITIVVPPALPAAMTVGRFYAQKRLEGNNIYCISPRSINVAGSIDCCCFDKTGTLTEDGLDMWGVVPKSATNQFQIPIKQIDRLPFDNFLFAMVTCHSITIMQGKMMGDPLDLKMFESTGWILEDTKDIPDNQKYSLIHPTIVHEPRRKNTVIVKEDEMPESKAVHRQSSVEDLLADVGLLNGESNNDHGIVREFPFTSSLQRMSVISRRLCEKHFTVYCKGSPEMLQQLCKPESIPNNYAQQLAKFAKQGYRIIAMAFKTLSRRVNFTKALRLSREKVECDLEFLGFVVLENRLKPDTSKVINSLMAANIRTIMVTGDNILTALSVARDCGIVNATQAVVTVNVRQLHAGDIIQQQQLPQNQHMHSNSNNYELYYTLDLGSMESAPQPATEVLKNTTSTNQFLDYGSKCQLNNGDMTSLNSISSITTSPNSSSFTSVQTCETWTHNNCELAFYPPKDNDWRQDYRFAMVGKTWQIVREHFPNELRSFITRGAIFARMSPEQKQSLIMELQIIDYCVAMCGDGANDCGALKVAHTGISLSETEASIASPFTSRSPTIACVPNVIKEGRTALVTSFGIFKYMAAYSMVQFISVMILYSIDSNLTDKQYLYIDLGLISVFAFFFGKTMAYTGPLVKQVPLSSLISLTPLASIMLHLLVVIGFQVLGWVQLHNQNWFTPFMPADEDHLGCYENYTMFAISSFQYIILAFVFSKGAPYRRPIWSNIPLCLAIFINLSLVIYLVTYPAQWLSNFFQLIMPPEMKFRYMMLIYGVFIFISHIIVETIIVEFLLFKRYQVRRDRNPRTSKRQYMHVEYDLQYFKNWPQITEATDIHETSILPQDAKPTYVEISAEQNCETPTPKTNSLYKFFEVEVGET